MTNVTTRIILLDSTDLNFERMLSFSSPLIEDENNQNRYTSVSLFLPREYYG